jgi:amicyanin
MSKKYVIFVLVVLVIIIGVFYLFFNGQKKSTPVQINQEPMPSAQIPVSTPPVIPTTTSTTTSTTTTTVTSSQTYNISVVNFSFNPNVLNINQGDTVVWTNQDSVPHQVWDNDFKGPVISNGQSYSFVFKDAGTFDYHCNIHPSMKGTIIVK